MPIIPKIDSRYITKVLASGDKILCYWPINMPLPANFRLAESLTPSYHHQFSVVIEPDPDRWGGRHDLS